MSTVNTQTILDTSDESPTSAAVDLTRKMPGVRILVLVGMTVGIVLMAVALFMPWASLGGSGQGLSEYGAPTPTEFAWILLALGLATSFVAGVSYVFGTEKAVGPAGAGAFLYLAGTAVWYGATILPTLVASGCTSQNPGTLCSTPATSPLIASSSPGPGFVTALIGAIIVVVVSLTGWRLLTGSVSRQSAV